MSKIVIVGGGVIGLCSAWYALQKGHQVTVLERQPAGGDSCSLGNAGMIVPSHFVPLAAPGMITYGLKQLLNPESPFSIRPRLAPELLDWGWKFYRASTPEHVERSGPLLRDLNNVSRRCYEELAETFGNGFGLVKKGLLMLLKSDHALQEEAALAEKARKLGIPAEVLTPEQTAKLDPNVDMNIAGSVYFPNDCHLTPQKFVASLSRRLKEQGAQFVYEATVTDWQTQVRRVCAVTAGGKNYEADAFVLAGGAWSPEIGKKLGINIPMQAGKGYSVTVEKPQQLPTICSILVEARVAVTPMGQTLRFGGTMEIAGNDLTVNPRRVEGIRKAVPNYFPRFSADDLRGIPVWSGLRPCSPDGLPYIGKTRSWENMVVATGHAMMGLSLGPVTGKLVAEVLANESPSLPLGLLSPDRYL